MEQERGPDRRGWRVAGFLLIVTLVLLWSYAEGAGPNRSPDRDLASYLAGQSWQAVVLETNGTAALAAGRPEEAVAWLEQARLAGGLTPDGWQTLGDAYLASGDSGAALDAWAEARAAGADPASILRRTAQVHRARGEYAAAIADLQDLARLDPEDANTLYQLGLLLAASDPSAALPALLQAAAMDENLVDSVRRLEASLSSAPGLNDPAISLFNAGRALAGLGEWTLAAEAFRQALLRNSAFPDAWAFLGEAMYHLGLDGSEMLDTALELDPDSLAGLLFNALNVRRLGQYSEALLFLARAQEVAPENPVVAVEMAQVYAQMGEVNQAIEQFLLAIELEPDDMTYRHMLAAYSIYNEIQVEQVGLVAARSAILRNPRDAVALDLVGYAYYLGGDFVTGMRFLFRAIHADPTYAPARLHLGMLYIARANPEAAREQLQLAVDLAPSSDAGRQALELLEAYVP